MKDIQAFTTEYGVASLILSQIPYRGEAYVRIQAAAEPEALLRECEAFCRAAGAGRIYASGHPALEAYPFHTAIWRMCRDRAGLPDTEAALRPVQEKTLEAWRAFYNRRMAQVPNAAWLTLDGARDMLAKGDGYFVHRGDALLGLGKAGGGQIDAVASCAPGGGRQIVLALAHACTEKRLTLEVASANTKAVRLYEGLGFLREAELSRWYQIL